MSNTTTQRQPPQHGDEIESTPANRVAVPSSRSKAYKACCTAWTICFWYGISNGIILTTKWLFTNHFPYPLTVTTYSNGVAFLWAALVSCWFPREPLTSELFYSYVLPIGLTTGLEIGASNVALKILSVSFGTILKGGGPIFTFLWGLAFGIEEFSFQVGISLILIAVGIALASLGEEHEFQFAGFILQLSASALGGLRWAMTHKLLKDGASGDGDAPKPMSPLTATLYTSPMTSLCVMPFALALEAKAVWNSEHLTTDTDALAMSSSSNTTQQLLEAVAATTNSTTDPDTNVYEGGDGAIVLSTMTLIATLVFILLMSEYWLVKATSSLALSVAGIFKELLTIGGGLFFFAEHIDALNVVGFTMCQAGILSYVCLRTKGALDNAADYAPLTFEDATREAMEAHREMLMDNPPERYDDEEDGHGAGGSGGRGGGGHHQFTIVDDDDDDML